MSEYEPRPIAKAILILEVRGRGGGLSCLEFFPFLFGSLSIFPFFIFIYFNTKKKRAEEKTIQLSASILYHKAQGGKGGKGGKGGRGRRGRRG